MDNKRKLKVNAVYIELGLYIIQILSSNPVIHHFPLFTVEISIEGANIFYNSNQNMDLNDFALR